MSRGLSLHILWVGLVIGAAALGISYAFYNPLHPANTTWQTMLFTTLAFLQIGQAWASRSGHESTLLSHVRSNPLLAWIVVLTIGLQLLVIYTPFLHPFFQVTPLSAGELLVCLLVGTLAWVAIEVEKLILRRHKRMALHLQHI